MDVERIRSEGVRGGRRVVATVRYDTPPVSREEIWFEAAPPLDDALDQTGGDPWLTLLLPLAATLGEPLRVAAPVDPRVLAGAREALRVWRSWYGHLAVVPLEAPAAVEAKEAAAARPARTASFFSGGADSFFTLLDHASGDGREERGPIHELLYLAGYDALLDQERATLGARANAQAVARAVGLPLHALATNARETRWRKADWTRLAHGSLLAATALLLAPRYTAVLIPASTSLRAHAPNGSDPYVDRLFSSRRTLIRHDGAAYRRWDKLALLASHPLVQRHLRVCFESQDGTNCGRCDKCVGTMLVLELFGGLAGAGAFGGRALDLDAVRGMRAPTGFQLGLLVFAERHARRTSRPELAAAAAHALERSARWAGWAPVLDALGRHSRWRRLLAPLRALLYTGRVPGPPAPWSAPDDPFLLHGGLGHGGPPQPLPQDPPPSRSR